MDKLRGTREQIQALRSVVDDARTCLDELRSRMDAMSKAIRCTPLGPDELLVRTNAGFYLVVPTWNIDVAIGVIRDGVIEPWTNAVVSHTLKRGDVFVNVGANYGYYAALGAHTVGSEGAVYAVEANPHIFVYLLKSIWWTGCPGVIRPFQFAAYSETVPEIKLVFDRQFLGGGSVIGAAAIEGSNELIPWRADNIVKMVNERREWQLHGLFTTVTTEGRRLDDTLPTERPVRLMMLDIEGAEPNAILGARELIRRSPGIEIVMEWWHGHYDNPERRPAIDAMWDFLLDDRKLKPHRICHEGYREGEMPRLEPLTREGLFKIPHGDVFLRNAA